MYALASRLLGLPVISLQTGEAVAVLQLPVVDPAALDLVAYRLESRHEDHLYVLMIRDIRQMALDCVIIDSEEELVAADDIVRIQTLLEANYSPIAKLVFTDLGRRLGVVEDYTINLETSQIQKLYVKQALWRSWFGASLIVDRTQIIDVTPKQIVVRDATIREPLMAHKTAPDIHP